LNRKELINLLSKTSKNTAAGLVVAKNSSNALALFYPILSSILNTIFNSYEYLNSERERQKIDERFSLLIDTLNKITRKQNELFSNFEANLIFPDFVRTSFIVNDLEKAKQHLKLGEMLYSSGRIDFDKVLEAVRILDKLSSREFLILKELPKKGRVVFSSLLEWLDVCITTEEELLKQSLLSMEQMGLINLVKITNLDNPHIYKTIDLGSHSEIERTIYAEEFLRTMSFTDKDTSE